MLEIITSGQVMKKDKHKEPWIVTLQMVATTVPAVFDFSRGRVRHLLRVVLDWDWKCPSFIVAVAHYARHNARLSTFECRTPLRISSKLL